MTRLWAGGGNDTLRGAAGADTMIGGTGNDTYFVDNAGDVVTENAGEGTDTVTTNVSYKCSPRHRKNFVLNTNWQGLNLTLTGNASNNTINGTAGNDILDGRAGNDTMIGGAGNDTYFVDSTGDVVTEAANGGTDTVNTTLLSYTLGGTLENLTFIGAGSFTGTGNALNNTVIGGASNDTLSGLRRQRRPGWWRRQ